MHMKEDENIQPEQRPAPRPHEPSVQELLRIHTGTVDGTAFMTIAGELDSSNVDQLKTAAQRLFNSGEKNLIIDMRAVTYMDVSGYHALIDIREMATSKGGQLVLVGFGEQVKRVVTILSLDRLMTIVDNFDQAIARIRHYPFATDR